MKSRRSARTSASAAPTSAAVDYTVMAPSTAPSVKARPPVAAPSLASNGALALTKSAMTRIQLSEPAALNIKAPAADVYLFAGSIRLSLPIKSFPSL